ncbi:hypothetical protein ACFOWY_09600 [Lysinibacter cavernae]
MSEEEPARDSRYSEAALAFGHAAVLERRRFRRQVAGYALVGAPVALVGIVGGSIRFFAGPPRGDQMVSLFAIVLSIVAFVIGFSALMLWILTSKVRGKLNVVRTQLGSDSAAYMLRRSFGLFSVLERMEHRKLFDENKDEYLICIVTAAEIHFSGAATGLSPSVTVPYSEILSVELGPGLTSRSLMTLGERRGIVLTLRADPEERVVLFPMNEKNWGLTSLSEGELVRIVNQIRAAIGHTS